MIEMKSVTKAMMRIVQPNPTRGSNCWAIAGYTKPPVPAPEAMMETAKDLFALK